MILNHFILVLTAVLFLCPVIHAQETGIITDIDGNVYQTVKIGGQWWMAENLKVSRYNNGDTIPQVSDKSNWSSLTAGATVYYNNDPENHDPYGKLYNWYAVSDTRGLCPTGWHVPTDSEWTKLVDYLGGSSVAYGKMKSTRTEPDPHPRWDSPNTVATNESGFSGLPGGIRTFLGDFDFLGSHGWWWSSSEYSANFAWFRSMSSLNINVQRNNVNKQSGYSVRCLKPLPSIQPMSSPRQLMGTPFWVEIKVGDPYEVTDLYGISFHLQGDTTECTYLEGSAEAGTFLGASPMFFSQKVDEQTVDIAVTRISVPGISGSGIIARAQFTTPSMLDSDLDVNFSVQNISAIDSGGETIFFDPSTLSVTVSPGRKIENLTVEPRATTAVLSWEPLQDTGHGVVQGYTIYRRAEGTMFETPVAYTGTDTFYIDSRLEMGTTYYYMITARIDHEESGQSDEVRITTLPTQDNLYTYANLKTAVLIYINTNAGEIPDDQIQRIKNAIEVARSFIWRNSLMKLNLQVTYYVIGDYKIFGDMGDYGGSVQKTAEHLKELGVMNTQYDIIYRVSPATGGFWSYGIRNLDLPGPSRQTGFSHSVWPTRSGVRYPGHDAETHYDLSWVFLHEVQHAIDAVYDANGLPQKHHGDRPHLFPYPAGEHYDFQAKMFRVFDKYEELLSNWGGIYESWDTGNYGFPDAEPLVAMDEVRFGSNPDLRDSDGDGLSDRDEFLDGIYSGSDPHNPDSNNSGIPDGNDPYPRYRVNTYIPERTSTMNGLKAVTQIVSIESVIYTQIGYSPKVYMTYDEDSLYIEIRLEDYCSHIEFQFDFESDGWWYGRGNTYMRINPHTGSITELLSQDASPEGRAFSQSIGGWAGGIWDDHPQYEPHFGRRVFEKDWIGLNVNTENPTEIIVALAIPKNEYAGLYLIPGDTFGINIYYYNVHDDPGQWASTFDVYSFVNFVFHDYDITQFAGGSGTENDPYLIETPEHLHTVRSFHWAHFLQIADIDLGVSPWNTDKGWLPIGDDYKKFTGSYDGNGFTISNLTIRRPDENWAGLFGYAHGAKLKNIGMKEADIRGGSFTGGLAGKIEQGIISNSYIEGRVSGNWCVGGLVGETADMSTVDSSSADVTVVCNNRSGGGLVGSNVNSSRIANSYATGSVSGGGSLGGLVGDHHNSSTHNSFAGGNISGGDILGGLIGNHAGGSKITNSYATGSVEGSREIGGLVGWNQSGSTITNSYSTGNVRGTESEESAGGLVGVQDGGSTAMHSYWNTNTSGKISSAGGEGRTTDEMSYPYAVNTYVNWDFIGIWKADTDYSMNNGYPYHLWKPLIVQPTYTLTLEANPLEGGTVSGGGSYEEGDTVTVSAVPSEGYVFVNWTIGDAVVMDGLDTAGVTFKYVMPPYDVLMAGNFNVAIADIPALLSPQNDAIHISVDTSLVWKESKRAVTYHVQVSAESEFVTCLIDSTGITNTSLEVRDLESLTRYYWRVCALNDSGASAWSEEWSFTTYDVTSVARYSGNIPTEYIIYQNYPNPFNPSTIIRYGLPDRCHVRLTVYNSLGQTVLRLVDEELEAGYYEVIFDASHLPSGVYIYRLQSGEFVHSKKTLYLK